MPRKKKAVSKHLYHLLYDTGDDVQSSDDIRDLWAYAEETDFEWAWITRNDTLYAEWYETAEICGWLIADDGRGGIMYQGRELRGPLVHRSQRIRKSEAADPIDGIAISSVAWDSTFTAGTAEPIQRGGLPDDEEADA